MPVPSGIAAVRHHLSSWAIVEARASENAAVRPGLWRFHAATLHLKGRWRVEFGGVAFGMLKTLFPPCTQHNGTIGLATSRSTDSSLGSQPIHRTHGQRPKSANQESSATRSLATSPVLWYLAEIPRRASAIRLARNFASK